MSKESTRGLHSRIWPLIGCSTFLLLSSRGLQAAPPPEENLVRGPLTKYGAFYMPDSVIGGPGTTVQERITNLKKLVAELEVSDRRLFAAFEDRSAEFGLDAEELKKFTARFKAATTSVKQLLEGGGDAKKVYADAARKLAERERDFWNFLRNNVKNSFIRDDRGGVPRILFYKRKPSLTHGEERSSSTESLRAHSGSDIELIPIESKPGSETHAPEANGRPEAQ